MRNDKSWKDSIDKEIDKLTALLKATKVQSNVVDLLLKRREHQEESAATATSGIAASELRGRGKYIHDRKGYKLFVGSRVRFLTPSKYPITEATVTRIDPIAQEISLGNGIFE